MPNPLMNIFGGNGNIFLQAVGSMMRGESPQEFMRKLANTNPALRGINLDDLNGEAQRICQEHGVDAGKLTEEIREKIGK